MKLVYPIRTGVFQKWISIAVKSFDTGLGINKSLLFLNCLYNLLKYAGMAYLLFNNYSFNPMLSKAIMEKCWLRILNLHKLFTYTWWRSTKSDETWINPPLRSGLFQCIYKRHHSKMLNAKLFSISIL